MLSFFNFLVIQAERDNLELNKSFMKKLALMEKKEIRLLIGDSLQQTVNSLGVTKSKKKTAKLINKSAKRIAELVAAQIKKEMKKIKSAKATNGKKPKAKTGKTVRLKEKKRIDEPALQTA
jgi:hypothetical protein